jgi:hypothetical protein
MQIYTELLKILVTFVILAYFWRTEIDMGLLFIMSFLIVYGANIVGQLCMGQMEGFEAAPATYELQRETADEAANSEQKIAITQQVFAENPDSILLNTAPQMTYVSQVNSTQAGSLDKLGYNAVFSLDCNNTYSSGSQGFMCVSPVNQRNLDTRGDNRGPTPFSGEL